MSIAFDDDGGPGLNARIARNLPAGSYSIRVNGFLATTGDYLLRVDCGSLVVPPAIPSESTYGYSSSGCAGSAGVLAAAMPQNQFAILGHRLRTELFNSSGGPSVVFVGFPSFELDLGIIGAPGCLLSTRVLATFPGRRTGPNTAESVVMLPSDPALAGSLISQQWAEIDLGAPNALMVTTSDRLDIIIGEQ